MFPNYKKTHPPFWLERNKWFKKLYALRRVSHYSKKPLFSYTDAFLDCLILYGVMAPDEGFFVDVGCFHPVHHNATYSLYKRGWRGINIDVDEVKIEAFNIKRPKDINIVCAVSERAGKVKYRKHSFWSQLNSLEELEKAKKGEWREVTVDANTLTHLIDQTACKGCPIDFLNVDVEGHEISVLRALDFDRYRPKVVCVEMWAGSLDEVMRSELYSLMVDRGYQLINWMVVNLVFLHQDCPPLRFPK